MVHLLLATLFAANFGLVIHFAQRSKNNLYAVGALNYTVATLFQLVATARLGDWTPQPGTYIIGILCGLDFVAGFMLIFPVMSLRGVSVATAMQRLSVVVPMAVGWLFWGETLAALPAVGVLVALASLPLLTLRPGEGLAGLRSRGALLLVALFLVNGGSTLAVRAFQQMGIEGESALFLAILFGTATLVTTAVWWRHRAGTSRRDFLPGVWLGLGNALAYRALMAALERLPGLLVFPFYSSVGMIFTVLFARLVWGERISRLEQGGIGLAVVAVILANV